MSNSGPSIFIARLHEHISERGDHYPAGRLGFAHIVIVKSHEKSEQAKANWDVFVQEGPASEPASPNAESPG